jgi:nucleotide-binding universal stress UspA family protein
VIRPTSRDNARFAGLFLFLKEKQEMLDPTQVAELKPVRAAQQQAPAVSLSPKTLYSRILIPTRLLEREREAVRLAMQLSTPGHPQITLLHVLPETARRQSLHWLDAIDNLHEAVSRPANSPPLSGDQQSIERWRQSALKFFGGELAHADAGLVNVRAECRWGDAGAEIARYAKDAAVDLVILTSGRRWSWLPGVQSYVQSALEETGSHVIVVRPGRRVGVRRP